MDLPFVMPQDAHVRFNLGCTDWAKCLNKIMFVDPEKRTIAPQRHERYMAEHLSEYREHLGKEGVQGCSLYEICQHYRVFNLLS